MSNYDIIKEEPLEELLYQVVKTSRKKFKTSDLPPLALELWRGQFVTTVYWWIGTSDNPWHIHPDVLSANLQTIWDTIYRIPYNVTKDSAAYNLVRVKIKFWKTNSLFFTDG